MRAYLSEMGETRCGVCLITTAKTDSSVHKGMPIPMASALRGWEMLTPEQVHTLETDLAVSLVEDEAFGQWSMPSVEVELMDVASNIYCDTCGRHLDGRTRKEGQTAR